MKILAIRGVLDSSTGHRFERSLMDLLREHQEPIGLDFSGLKYMTSAGVASFLRVSQRARERNLKLGILRPSQEVGMMLEFLGIAKHIPVFQSEEEMRAAMPETVQSLDVVEKYSIQSPEASSSGLASSGSHSSGVKGGILPTSYSGAGMAGGSSVSSDLRSPASGGSEEAFHMGQSMGRLSETLDGLTRNLKSLGKTMEDLQRTEHSLKEEFEKDRAARRSGKVQNSDGRSFAFSESGSGSGTAKARPGASGAVEVPVARMKDQAPGSASQARNARAGLETSAARRMSASQPAEMNRILECEQCGSKLRIYHAGRHLCPACKIEFEVETDGSTSYYEKLATS
ncbi:MAG TPA: hypothetical protein DEA96_12010 [Leptospiraceae bacterium]|nr:hypothetical protein [Spirochaetaceae bacterium]HBS05684.1 hypothetical protein [Leptospiraceae bacterium]|tara:strand:+ start:17210 stop:18238 length:1029 start_codon:yes stop_codon:yes gene_type:complete